MFLGELDKSREGKRWERNLAAPRGDQED